MNAQMAIPLENFEKFKEATGSVSELEKILFNTDSRMPKSEYDKK